MKFRIIVSKTNLSEYLEGDQLKTLYLSEKFAVQGSDAVTTLSLVDGRQAFLIGNLVGIRSSQNEIIPCASTSVKLKELIRTSSIEECQEVIEGRFILAVVGPGETISICTDRFGQSDFYYLTTDNTNIFASDLSLMPISSVQNGFDQIGLAHALTVYGYRPAKSHTLYSGIRRLDIGEIVNINQGQVEFSKVKFKPARMGNYGQRELNEYADLLLEAVRVRGSRYGNVVYLSSGWDSTSILACLVHLFGARKVRSVIGRMKYAERSGIINQWEVDRAKAFADYFGVHLDIVDFDFSYEVPKMLDDLRPVLRSHHIGGLTCLTHGILANFVARTTNGNEAVFAGEISDGVHNLGFSQFTTIFHPVMAFREYSDKMASYLFGPTFLGLLNDGRYIDDPIYNLFRSRFRGAIFDEPASGNPSNVTRQLLASFFLRANRFPLWSLRNTKMLTEEGIMEYGREMESTYLDKASELASRDTLYAWYIHLYNSFHWQGSTVATLPLTAQVNGLDLALPFWDSRIQEFLSAMPEEWGRGLDLNPTKYPLKWMLKNRIDYPYHLQVGPHSYLYDVNPSFSLAAEIIYGSAFAPYFKTLLRPRTYHDLLSSNMFNLAYIDGLVDHYLDGIEIRGAEMNDLVSLFMLLIVGWYGS